MHPTNLGMYNEAISGDNKGWAALQFESDINGFSRTDFVAAFANSNCGDVSGNVQRDGNGNIVRTNGEPVFEWPRGGPANLTALQKNITAMRDNGNLQFYAAKAVFDGSNLLKEIDGSVDSRYTHVDMSNVTLTSGLFAGSRTWPAVMGVSFGAGSTEDGEAIAYILSHPISSGIIEGITNPSYDAVGPAAIFRLSTAIAGVVGPAAVLGILTGGIGLIPALVGVAAGGALGVAIAKAILDAANPLEQAYISAVGGYLGLVVSRLFVHNIPRFSDGTTFNIVLPSTIDTPQSVIDGHFPKPIMFAAGLAKTDEFSGTVVPCPMVPNVVPIQLLRIGKLAVAGIPGEITTMGGIRLRNSILASMTGSSRVDTVALCTYCNSYSGYISTFEEYQSQQYEGASTLYGPHTLEAYQQIFSGMATAMSSSLGLDAVGLVDPGPESLPGIYVAP